MRTSATGLRDWPREDVHQDLDMCPERLMDHVRLVAAIREDDADTAEAEAAHYAFGSRESCRPAPSPAPTVTCGD